MWSKKEVLPQLAQHVLERIASHRGSVPVRSDTCGGRHVVDGVRFHDRGGWIIPA